MLCADCVRRNPLDATLPAVPGPLDPLPFLPPAKAIVAPPVPPLRYGPVAAQVAAQAAQAAAQAGNGTAPPGNTAPPAGPALPYHESEWAHLTSPLRFKRVCLEPSHVLGWSEYAAQLHLWLALYGHESMLAVYTEDLADDPLCVVRKVEAHLGLHRDVPTWGTRWGR